MPSKVSSECAVVLNPGASPPDPRLALSHNSAPVKGA